MFTSQAETETSLLPTCLHFLSPIWALPCKCQTPKCRHPSRGLAHQPTRPHGTWDLVNPRGIPPGHRLPQVEPRKGEAKKAMAFVKVTSFLASLSNPFMINHNITGICWTSFRQHGTTQKKKHFSNLCGRCYLSWGRVIRLVRQSSVSESVVHSFLPSFIRVSLVSIAKFSMSIFQKHLRPPSPKKRLLSEFLGGLANQWINALKIATTSVRAVQAEDICTCLQ